MVEVGYDEIVNRYPGDIPYSQVYVETQIADAITELYERIPDLDARVADGRIRQASIVKIVAKAVIGALRNAEGYRQESDGDYSYSRFGDGFVWFSQADIDRLRGVTYTPKTIRVGLPCGGSW